MTLDHVAAQMDAEGLHDKPPVDKWRTFQDIREAREKIGATDRSLAILNALLSFYPETVLSAQEGLIVWPSNEQLIARSNGMSPATLRRHLAVLVHCGLIIRRDSPNGKRFARKGWDGQLDQAYGFDLSPVVARARAFAQMAEDIRAERRALRVARERVTLLRRDIAKTIETGIHEGVPGNWGAAQTRYVEIMARLPRQADRTLVGEIGDELEALYAELRQALESFVNSLKMNANESHNEQHIHNSNPDSHKESEDRSRNQEEEPSSVENDRKVESLPKRDLPLGIVLDACPGLIELNGGRAIVNWRDFVAAAEFARPMLGISTSAWAEALAVLGAREAAITLAAIYQKGEAVKSAGGYLRSLVDRAKDNKFSTWPMIMALLRAKLDAEEPPRTQGPEHSDGNRKAGISVSPSLLQNLAKPR
ncbi:replication initiation protein RepC [Pelagibacterium luteolum]|uniref:Replication initiation protein RepC n=2 Tax=Pelagibacterium luteolum TaxID=440168 RepID=A0A1G7ZZQ0_9HYPH|nr:replication initiation protein RepC [Pelagibacterium luteolum]